jgi:hypothetical protein
VCNTLLLTYHTYLFISSFIYGYISFFFAYCKSCRGGGDGTSFEYCPLPAGVYSCRSGTSDKPTQRDTDRPLTARKGEKFISKSQFASLHSCSLKLMQCLRIHFLSHRKHIVSSLGCLEGREDSLHWPRDIVYPQMLTLTSPTRGCRSVGIVFSRTQAKEFVCVCVRSDRLCGLVVRVLGYRSGGPA